jgi:energy-coupling factor transport system ATP-binding protein
MPLAKLPFEINNLTFTYPDRQKPCLSRIDLQVQQGEFIVLCGKSGSGKSTLLRHLKPSLTPHGSRQGEIAFYGVPIGELSHRQETEGIGYVLQNPDHQLVTDKVWHELAFGLESLGYDSRTIRLRVAEMASFFGIQTWYRKDVTELSGGQKQLLNLAAVMVMQPDVLILDEPTSQLDPIAASEFLDTVKKINREIGTTVILSEHRLEEVIPMADRVVVLDQGEVLVDDIPDNAGAVLFSGKHPMFYSMPTPLRVYSQLYEDGFRRELPCPITVREGRQYLNELLADQPRPLVSGSTHKDEDEYQNERLNADDLSMALSEVWFSYHRQEEPVIKDLSLQVRKGELYAIVGGNGTGKTTALSLIAGLRKPLRGKLKMEGKVCMLPQDPQALFVEMTVREDLLEIFSGVPNLSKEEQLEKMEEMARLVEIQDLLDYHPYDLSGGEQQRAALAKVLLLEPDILLLDEPTKGIDNFFKESLGEIFRRLKERGTTIIMVSHDIEFCCRYGDTCAMFFDGSIITVNSPREFFSGNSFYTTAANRMSRHLFPRAVTAKDVIESCRDSLNPTIREDSR